MRVLLGLGDPQLRAGPARETSPKPSSIAAARTRPAASNVVVVAREADERAGRRAAAAREARRTSARQRARDLARAVGAEVHEDDRRRRRAMRRAGCPPASRDHRAAGRTRRSRRARSAASSAASADGARARLRRRRARVGRCDALPALVAVHRVVAAARRSRCAAPRRGAAGLEPSMWRSAELRRRVAAVEERVDETRARRPRRAPARRNAANVLDRGSARRRRRRGPSDAAPRRRCAPRASHALRQRRVLVEAAVADRAA